jgi:hypothetical protein
MATRGKVLALAMAALALQVGTAGAQSSPTLPTNDLQGALALTGAQTPAPVPYQTDEPPLRPVPRAACDADSQPLAGEQGRVPPEAINSPQAARGWTCNLRVVSRHETPGGFRVWRYDDANGHSCAFYDTSLVSAANIASLAAGPSQGVVVLDMTDPAHPKQTDMLTAPAMISPHESLNLNAARGLLAAETGTSATAPGVVSLYDVRQDCRRPLLQSNYAAAPFGHESGFSPDGRTFWIGGGEGIIGVDVTDPRNPHTVLSLNEFSHGINLSDDGRTLYATNVIDGGLTVLDVGQVQDRRPDPRVREISRLTWDTTSIPQNTNPMTIGGHRYLLEYDEFAFRFNPATVADKAGAARIIDIADPAHPKVVSNLRLEVNMPDRHKEANGDPNFQPGPALTYGAHYCNIPREVDPEIVACSFLNSGLRIFDIRDPLHPREAAYFVSPPETANGQRSDAAFAQPAFDPARRQVWYSDATSGFWNVQLDDAAWPHPAGAPAGATRRCTSKRAVTVHVRRPRRGRIASVRVTVGGRRLAVRRQRGRYVVTVSLVGQARVTTHVRVVVRTTRGRRYTDSRTYHPCRRGPARRPAL